MENKTVKKTMPRVMQGKVVSNKMMDSIVVQVERTVQHKLYGKIIKRRSKIHAHDAGNTCHIGDIVNIKECRPISKTKTWTLTEIKTRAAE
jgi:small subunit ribosomal protein S17